MTTKKKPIPKSKTSEYRSYQAAKSYCNCPSNRVYGDYGGKGVQFKFKSFEEFLNDVGKKPSKKRFLTRISKNGHYEPGNVMWSLDHYYRKSAIFITVKGKTKTYQEWAKILKIKPNTVYQRLRRGWSGDEIVKKRSINSRADIYKNIGISAQVLYSRLKAGWCDECLINIKPGEGACRHQFTDKRSLCFDV